MSQAPSPPPPSPMGDASPQPRGLRLLCERWGYSLVTGAFFGILGFMLMVVVPKFAQMFEAIGLGQLPVLTAALIVFSRWTCRWWPLYATAAISLAWLVALIPPKKWLLIEIALIVSMATVTGLVVCALFLPCIHVFGASE